MSNNKKAVPSPNSVSSRMMLQGRDNDRSGSLELSVSCSGRRKKLNDSIKCNYMELVVRKHDMDQIITWSHGNMLLNYTLRSLLCLYCVIVKLTKLWMNNVLDWLLFTKYSLCVRTACPLTLAVMQMFNRVVASRNTWYKWYMFWGYSQFLKPFIVYLTICTLS